VVYAPPGGKFFATLESHPNLSAGSGLTLNSEFITKPHMAPLKIHAWGLQLFSRSECRNPWPPPSQNCCECGCTVSVQVTNVLQDVIDRYQNLPTLTEICLAAGTYNLTAPLQFTSTHLNITLKACQPGSVTLQAKTGWESQFHDGWVVLHSATNITLQGLQFVLDEPCIPHQVSVGGLIAGEFGFVRDGHLE
jgi:hypothetical protein